MSRQTETDWIVEGATVYEYQSRFHDLDWIEKATIAKLTKTQIVLDNGNRYNRETLTKIGEKGGGWSSGRTELKAADDPTVLDVRAARVWTNLARRIEKAERARDNRLGRERVLAMLDELERAVQSARDTVIAQAVDAAGSDAEKGVTTDEAQ